MSRIDKINGHIDSVSRIVEDDFKAGVYVRRNDAIAHMEEVRKLLSEEVKAGTSLATLSKSLNISQEVLHNIIEGTWQ